MAEQTQTVEQPETESTADLDALLDAKFGTAEQPEEQESEAPTGDEAPEQPESEQPTEQPEYAEVEFNGAKYQVPPELKDALMAQSDYTAKTTELANTRRVLEAQQKEAALFHEQRSFEQSIAQDADRLKMLDAYIQHAKTTTDWTTMTTDQVVRAKLELDQLSEQRNELARLLEGKRNEFTQKLNEERGKLKATAKEILSKAVQGWNDQMQADVEKYVQTMGYPEFSVQNMGPLDYQVAWKAMQYDKIKTQTKTAVKRAAEAPTIAPTARKTPMPKDVRTKLDLRKAVQTGRKDVIESALDKRLSQMFGER